MTVNILTVDAEAHIQLSEALLWVHSRPQLLQLESYENDQSQNKMIGFLLDHMYEADVAEQAEGDCSWFTRFWFRDGQLMVTDWNNFDYEIRIKQ